MAQGVCPIQGLDLHRWLWNTLCFSPALIQNLSQHISSQLDYQLTYWQKPHVANNLKAILKIAACVEKGARVKQIIKKSAIDEVKIKIK